MFQTSATIACAPSALFEFLARPANFLRLTPPDVSYEIVEAPEKLELGSIIILKGRRWGVVQRLVSAVTHFEIDALIIDEQQHGPFRRLVRSQRFDADPVGVRLTDKIEFEAPGGILGLLLTPQRIAKELAELADFRTRQLKLLLEPQPT